MCSINLFLLRRVLQPEQHAICRIIVVVDQCDMIGGSEQSDLTLSKNQCRRNKWGPDTTTTTAEHSLYLLKDFKLIHQQPLKFAKGFYLSSNHGRDINEEHKNSWHKAHLMLGFYTGAGGNPNYVNHEDLKNAIDAVVDENPSEKQMSDAIAYFRVNHKLISLDDFRSFSTCGKQHPAHILLFKCTLRDGAWIFCYVVQRLLLQAMDASYLMHPWIGALMAPKRWHKVLSHMHHSDFTIVISLY